MPTALVTGGCGFVGVNLGRVLSQAGWTLVAYDDLSTGHQADAAANGYERIVEGDVRDADALRKAADGCDYMVHLAAHTGVVPSVEDPLHDASINVGGTVNALLAARDAGVAGFVFASSNAPLGEVAPPVHEGLLPRPLSPYGASKMAGEAYCSAFAASYGLPTTVLRFTNLYGPFSYHKGSVVATFLKAAHEGRPLVVYGDGEQTRDFVYVDDLCAGIRGALESGAAGEVFHLGSGVETSVNELVALIRGLFPERELEVRHEPERPGEIRRTFAAIAKAKDAFGYEPRVALPDGLAATNDWFAGAGAP